MTTLFRRLCVSFAAVSSGVLASPAAGQFAAPVAPSGAQVFNLGDGQRAHLKWTDNSSNETGFQVVRQKQIGLNWTPFPVINLPANAKSLTDAPGPGVFRYQVRAIGLVGASALTAPVQVTVVMTTPTVPGGLAFQDLGDGQRARLTWADQSNNESGFELRREKQAAGAWTGTVTLPMAANATVKIDTPGAGTWRYRIRSVNGAGSSAWSAWVVGTVAPGAPPAAPSNLVGFNLGTGAGAHLKWTDNANNETGFTLERETQNGGVWGSATSVTIPKNYLSYTDNSGPGMFRYRLRAFNGSGASAPTPWVQVAVVVNAPTVPGNLAFQDLGNALNGRLTWTDQSNNESGFEILHETKNASGVFVPTGTLTAAANTTMLTIGPGPGAYRFRIRSSNAAGSSSWSAWVPGAISNDPQATPATPSNLTAIDAGNRKAMLSWTDNSNNETGFQIERQPAFTGGAIGVSANVTGYLDSCGAGAFSYRLRAVGASGASAWTAWVSVVVSDIPPAAPSGLTAMDIGQNTIRLSWLDNSDNETGFEIERQTQSGGTWGAGVTLTSPPNTTTKDDVAGPGTHRYRLRSVNAVGQSAWTAWVTAAAAFQGWTSFTASPDTLKVHVSSSSGNDSNPGTELFPKKTLAAAYASMRDGFPDWMLLKRGDTWTNESLGLWDKSGRSASEPMLIGTYGPDTTARPLIKTGVKRAIEWFAANSPSLEHLAIVGLHFRPHLYSGTANYSSGIFLYGKVTNILFEDCMVEGFATNVVVQDDGPSRPNTIRFRRCAIVDSFVVGENPHAEGMYLEGIDGLLLEECVIDHNGWREDVPGAVQTVFRHNVYIQSDCSNTVFRRNFCTQGAATGVQARSGGVVEDNILVRNPVNIVFGGGDDPLPGGVSGAVRGNVVLQATALAGESRGWGLEIMNVNATGVVVEDNLFAHDQNTGNQRGINLKPTGYGAGVGVKKATIRDNVIYKWNSGIIIDAPAAGLSLTAVTVQNNVIQEPSASSEWLIDFGPSSIAPSVAAFSGNKYHSGRPANAWFAIAGAAKSYQQWVAASSEPGSIASVVTMPAPTRDLATYHASIGGAATLQAFMTEVRKQRKGAWKPEYTVEAALAYVRAGYGVNP